MSQSPSVQLAFAFTQRWRNRRERRVPANGAIDALQYSVEQISYGDAKNFVTANHYSGSMSTCILAAGLFHKTGVQPSRLVGVVVFGVPMTSAVLPKHTGVEAARGAEITRLILDHEVPGNGESMLTARAVRLLDQAVRTDRDARGRTEPRVRALVTFADPSERRLADGTIVKRGHYGGLYQSLSMTYGGRTAPRWLWLTSDARVVSERSLSKIRNEEAGMDYAARQLTDAGAPERRPGETPREWVARALSEGPFIRQRHPGNHVYAWGLDREARRLVSATLAGRGDYPKPDLLRPTRPLLAA